MGLSRTDYIVYGWKLPLNMTDKDGNEINFWDDKFLPYIEGHKGEEYTIVRDDNFMAFGKLVAIDSDGWDFKHLDTNNLNKEEVKNKYNEVFEVEGSVSDPYLFIFSHWN